MTGIVGFTHAYACTCSAQDLGHRPSSAPGALSRPPPSLAALGGSGSKRGASRRLGQWARGSRCWVAAARRVRDRAPGRRSRCWLEVAGTAGSQTMAGGGLRRCRCPAVPRRSRDAARRRRAAGRSMTIQDELSVAPRRQRHEDGALQDDNETTARDTRRHRDGPVAEQHGRAPEGGEPLSVASTAAPGAIRLRPRRTPDRPGPIGPAAGPWAGWRSGRLRRAVRRPS